MARRKDKANFFLGPTSPIHRRYEALRSYFVENLTVSETAQKSGYTTASIRSIVRDFNRLECPQFFLAPKPGPKSTPKKSKVWQKVVTLRKQNWSIHDIKDRLRKEGFEISHTAISEILRDEGFARLPKRTKEESRKIVLPKPEMPEVADVRRLSLKNGREVSTEYGGLFLFLPLLTSLDLYKIVDLSEYPGSSMIPAVSALLSMLTLKLIDKERQNGINDLSFDEGVGLFVGLNVPPKSTYATTYSYMTTRQMNLKFLSGLVRRASIDILLDAKCFNLDFHAIPHRGEENVLENHYVPSKGKARKSALTFFAQDSQTRILCYSNAEIKKTYKSDEILQFIEFWKDIKGEYPSRLFFDSKLTTYEKLNTLNKNGIIFTTVRKRGQKLLQHIHSVPKGEWESCKIDTPKRKHQRVKYLEMQIAVTGYDGTIRQIVVKDHGRESPSFFLTNDKMTPTGKILTQYSQRNRIENSIGENVNFFHMDCLSSDIPLNVDFDVTVTVLASLLYRMLARRLVGFEKSGPKTIFRKFILSKGDIKITDSVIQVMFKKRACNPIVKSAILDRDFPPIPWLGNRKVILIYP